MGFPKGLEFKALILGSSRGYILPLVLALVVLGSLALIPLLRQIATGTKGVTTMRNWNVESQTAGSGIEQARWRLQFESGFADSINQSSPVYTYAYPINNRSANITINWVSPIPSPTPTPPPGGPQSDRASVEYSFVPSEFLAGQPVNITVTITATNIGTSQLKFEQIGDQLPASFAYTAGTSSGFTSSEPLTQMVSGRQEVTWNWGPPHPEIEPGQFIQQMFQASAIPLEGIYYNEAWIVFTADSAGTVRAGNGYAIVSQYRRYDVMSKVGNVTLKSRLGKNDINVTILSWQR